MHEEKLIAFLQGIGSDGQGRRHGDILNYSDEDLEEAHDYIQWLFPLRAPSMAVPDSPVLESEAALQSLRSDASVREHILGG